MLGRGAAEEAAASTNQVNPSGWEHHVGLFVGTGAAELGGRGTSLGSSRVCLEPGAGGSGG